MYGLATRMTEIIAKERWEDLVRRHLFQALGMQRSTFARGMSSDDLGNAQPIRSYYGTLKAFSPRLAQ